MGELVRQINKYIWLAEVPRRCMHFLHSYRSVQDACAVPADTIMQMHPPFKPPHTSSSHFLGFHSILTLPILTLSRRGWYNVLVRLSLLTYKHMHICVWYKLCTRELNSLHSPLHCGGDISVRYRTSERCCMCH